jgi:hypothetical protein
MPIVDIQRRFRELGRLRMGAKQSYTDAKGKQRERPIKLARWRLTTPWRHLLEAAVDLGAGGEVREWSPDGDRKEFELVTDTPALDILIPPGEVLDQWYELWSGGGLIRRCDGARMVKDAGKTADKPCRCPADPEERQRCASLRQPTGCKPTSRLLVMLPGLPDLGVWRLESHGYYAASELAGAATLIELAARRGIIIPAELRIESRKIKRQGETVKKFAVPVISLPRAALGTTLAAIGFGDANSDLALQAGATRALGAGADLSTPPPPAALTGPVEARPSQTHGGTPDLGDQAEPFDPPPPVEEATVPAPPADVIDVEEVGTEDPEATAIPDAPLPVPDAFEPPEYDDAEAAEQEGRAYTPAQLIAMRAREHDLDDDTRHAIIRVVTRGRTQSGKDLDSAEVTRVLGVIDGIADKRVGMRVFENGWTFTQRQDGNAGKYRILTATVLKDGTTNIEITDHQEEKRSR